MAAALGRTLYLGIDAAKAQDGARDFEEAIRRVDGASTKTTASTARAQAAFSRLERQLDPVAAATARLERGQRTLDEAFKRGSIGIERHAQLMDKLRETTSQAELQQSRLARVMQSFGSGVAAGLGAAGIATGIGELARGFVTAADAAGRMDSQLRVATGSVMGAHEAFGQLYSIAARTGTPVEALVALYSRMSGAAKDLGASQGQMLTLTEAVSNALKIGGQSASEASGALLQLGQALGSPNIQMEEFGSLLDGMRPLLQAVANHIEEAGGSVGKLTALVKEGRISNEDFFRAAIAGADDLAKQAASMEGTWSSSIGRMQDATTRLVGNLDGLTGTTSVVKSAFLGIADTIDTVSAAVEGLGGSIGAQLKVLDGLAAHQREVIARNDSIEGWLRQHAGDWAGDLFGKTRWDKSRLAELEGAANDKRAEVQKATAEAAAPAVSPAPTGEVIRLAPKASKPARTSTGRSRSSERDTSERDYKSAESAYDRYQAGEIQKETQALKEQEQAYSGLEQLRIHSLELSGREIEALQMRRDIALKGLEDEKLSTSELAEARSLTVQIYDKQISDIQERQNQVVTANTSIGESTAFLSDSFRQMGSIVTSSFEDAIIHGKKFSTVLDGLLGDIQRTLIRTIMMKTIMAGFNAATGGLGGLGGLISGLFGGGGSYGTTGSGGMITSGGTNPGFLLGGAAQGAVLDRGNVIPFARGGVVDRPTLFPMARGTGLMGEAGPEAVLPLKRLAGGNLGVQAAGAAAPTVNLTIVNNAGVSVTQGEQKKRDDGGIDMTLIIESITNHMAAEAARPGTAMNRAIVAGMTPLRKVR